MGLYKDRIILILLLVILKTYIIRKFINKEDLSLTSNIRWDIIIVSIWKKINNPCKQRALVLFININKIWNYHKETQNFIFINLLMN